MKPFNFRKLFVLKFLNLIQNVISKQNPVHTIAYSLHGSIAYNWQR